MTAGEHGRSGSGSAPAPPAPGEEHAIGRPEEDAAHDERHREDAGHTDDGLAEAGRQHWPLAPRGHDEGGGGADRRASPAAARGGDEDRPAQAARQGTATSAPDRGAGGTPPGQGAGMDPPRDAQGARAEPAAATSAPDRGAQSAPPGRAAGTDPSRGSGARSGREGGDERLFAGERASEYQRRFSALKGEFVDDPRRAVREVDGLVGEMLEELTRRFHGQRDALAERLSDEHADTEELRHAFAGYRAFLDRLLAL